MCVCVVELVFMTVAVCCDDACVTSEQDFFVFWSCSYDIHADFPYCLLV